MLTARYVTTGNKPIVGGSTESVTLSIKRNGFFWDLTAATLVEMHVEDPTGAVTVYSATVSMGVATSQLFSLVAMAGTWLRSWHITYGGLPYITDPIGFNVVAAP